VASTNGHALFATDPERLLVGIRSVGQGTTEVVDADTMTVLREVGLVGDAALLAPGLDLYQVAWVRRDLDEGRRLLGQALRAMVPVQVIEQELRGHGAVAEDGVLDLLRLHRAVPMELTVDQVRATFRWLNTCGVLVYSRKDKTVRAVPADPDALVAGEGGMAAMISPRTPFSNVARLRRVLRSQSGVLTWADPHFGTRALEELVFELDPNAVSAVRILSGDAENVLSGKSWKDFDRFREEMKIKGVEAEWRVDKQRDWHDRWLRSDAGLWNMPPVNNLFQNQFSEILPSAAAVPVDEWWSRAEIRTS
jgi:hypothetical protein